MWLPLQNDDLNMKNLILFSKRLYASTVDYFQTRWYRKALAILIIGLTILYPILFHHGFTDIMEHEKTLLLYELKLQLYKKQIACQFVSGDSVIKIETEYNEIAYDRINEELSIHQRTHIDHSFDTIIVWFDYRAAGLPVQDFSRDVSELEHPHKLVFKDAFLDISFTKVLRILENAADDEPLSFFLNCFSYVGRYQGVNSKAQLLSQKYYNLSHTLPNLQDIKWWKAIQEKSNATSTMQHVEQMRELENFIVMGM